MAYTLVQHSGYVVGGNYQFQRAVELRSLNSTKETKKVQKVGGLVFLDYSGASAAEMVANYPPEVLGLVPRVRGSFSTKKVQGQRIYIPEEGERPNYQRVLAPSSMVSKEAP